MCEKETTRRRKRRNVNEREGGGGGGVGREGERERERIMANSTQLVFKTKFTVCTCNGNVRVWHTAASAIPTNSGAAFGIYKHHNRKNVETMFHRHASTTVANHAAGVVIQQRHLHPEHDASNFYLHIYLFIHSLINFISFSCLRRSLVSVKCTASVWFKYTRKFSKLL